MTELFDMPKQKVMVVCGSRSDLPIAKEVEETLKAHKVKCEVKIASAHREPDKVRSLVEKSKAQVFVAIAGLSAALPGFIASITDKPVIGVPVSVKLGGLDALLSMAQTPAGVPVATVGIDNGTNAAHLAMRILKLSVKPK